ncbi:hypothetical protein [Glycomyces artemisiae]|uniref:Uncharacterized protein n=1 Tax=Glycomyces artemisiae TaxID=1076443 RepID=A0A2T0U899_9ACTN|nr:hypothetical protein [Glycomyces artemisiae]PRY54151.1 hypothetical protein B0I28_1155 [Glycomyces artemisiae]
MSATPPFGPAYDEQPDDGRRSGSGQWRPRAGRPQGSGEPYSAQQGDQGQYQGGQPSPGRGRQGGYGQQQGWPQAGRPSPQAGRPSPQAGAPRAGGPSAGRGPQAGQYQSPQQQFSPQHGGYEAQPGGYEAQPGGYEAQPGGYESRRSGGPVTGSTPRTDPRSTVQGGREYRPRPGAPEGSPRPRQDQPFEEAAFGDERGGDDWGGGGETTAIKGLGSKEPRRRSDFQKVRSRARKSSPWPKVIAAVVALGLVGGGVWWFMNRDSGEEQGGAADAGLTYAGSEEPCSLVDAAALEPATGGAEPAESAVAEQKTGSWHQKCDLTYGEPDQAAAMLTIEGSVYESDAMASVNFDLGTGDMSEMPELWTIVDPAPSVGDEAAAISRVVTDGTSNYQLHVQDDNAYLVVRLAVSKDAGVDEAALTDMTTQLAEAYLANWRDAS